MNAMTKPSSHPSIPSESCRAVRGGGIGLVNTFLSGLLNGSGQVGSDGYARYSVRTSQGVQ